MQVLPSPPGFSALCLKHGGVCSHTAAGVYAAVTTGANCTRATGTPVFLGGEKTGANIGAKVCGKKG